MPDETHTDVFFGYPRWGTFTRHILVSEELSHSREPYLDDRWGGFTHKKSAPLDSRDEKRECDAVFH